MVSVLFIDLVGFTAFSEGRDPEEVRGLITEYFDVARDVIERFGGTVDKFIGDAVMAWWGATTSQEDDAERAVRSALEVVDAVASLGERLGVAGLAARSGVMTGEVAVGPGGNEKGLLLGDLVNSTSRLQSLAEPGMVFIGDVTAGLVNRAIDLEAAGTHHVKGKEEPIVAWRATRVLSERGGRGRVDMLEPPFVGRVSELRLLKDTLAATGRDRRARLVSLVGQAGIGKSRLIREFSNYVDGLVDDIYWHEGRSPSYGDGLALWALGEMIRGRAGIQETDSPEVTADRL
ncbi:MAG TPA: adenylate/guanylate cyclase domain-containing protein, partial [Acidimicrobiia bacterium]